ncbi:hypothetical protein OIU79_024416 [Salix purpurea]|uniref:Uncharacterized protein n=1 Tax=Salix purpurea TaxID=77065 RepID=A0A9Q0WDX9_SALPP|nr:hypothetical protein OIU79_024416 [Salix purpurea]
MAAIIFEELSLSCLSTSLMWLPLDRKLTETIPNENSRKCLRNITFHRQPSFFCSGEVHCKAFVKSSIMVCSLEVVLDIAFTRVKIRSNGQSGPKAQALAFTRAKLRSNGQSGPKAQALALLLYIPCECVTQSKPPCFPRKPHS